MSRRALIRPPWRSAMRVGGLAAMAAGLTLAGVAAWVPAKARLGQHLLHEAFARAQAAGAPAQPWAWADFAAVARITAPRIGAEAIALNASTGAAMAWGPGAVPGLDRMEAGLIAFAGHRDTHLAFLGDLRPGDEIIVEDAAGARQTYRVTGAHVVDSRRWRFPAAGEGLMLATCWPLDAQTDGPLRLIVSASPVSPGRGA